MELLRNKVENIEGGKGKKILFIISPAVFLKAICLKHRAKKEKLLIMSNFSFSYRVFYLFG